MIVSRQLPLPPARLAALADGESIYGTEDGGADSALITNDAAAPALVLSWSGRPTVVAGRLGLASGVNGGLFLPRYASGSLAGITAKAEGLTVWNDTTHLPNFWNGTTWIAGDGSGGIAMPDPGAGTLLSVPYSNAAGAYLLSPAPGGNVNTALAVNDAGNALQWRRYMPATLVYGTNFLPQNTGQLLNANDGTTTFSVYGQEAYVGQGSNILKMRAKLSPTADDTQLSVGSSDGFYGAMEVWATGKAFYVYHASNLTSPRNYWLKVDDTSMVANVPMDVRAGDVIIHGDEVTLSLPAGKSAAVYEVVFTGNNGADARYVLPAVITVTRSDGGTITGNMTPLPSWPLTPPGWVTEPELNDGVNSVIITLTAAGTWQTTVRTKALTSV